MGKRKQPSGKSNVPCKRRQLGPDGRSEQDAASTDGMGSLDSDKAQAVETMGLLSALEASSSADATKTQAEVFSCHHFCYVAAYRTLAGG